MKPKRSLVQNAVIAFVAVFLIALLMIGTYHALPFTLLIALISGLIAALFACAFTLRGQVSALEDRVAQLEDALQKRR